VDRLYLSGIDYTLAYGFTRHLGTIDRTHELICYKWVEERCIDLN